MNQRLSRAHLPRVFIDIQPTSGLDAPAASKVVRVLRELSRNHNTTVILSIHQPPSDVFGMIDNLLLLVPGKTGRSVAFFGPPEQSLALLKDRGVPVPNLCNPLEFLVGKDEKGRFNTDVLSAAYISSPISATMLQRIKHMSTPHGMAQPRSDSHFAQGLSTRSLLLVGFFVWLFAPGVSSRIAKSFLNLFLLCTDGANVVTPMTTADVGLSFASSCLQFVLLSARGFTFVFL
jgi:hypothetical protein